MLTKQILKALLDTKALIRSACFWLCIVYVFTNVAFAHKAEANFWSERQKTVQSIKSNSETDVVKLAALPTPILPALGSANLTPHPLSFSLKGEGSLAPPLTSGRGAGGEGVLGTIPWAYATFKDASIKPGSGNNLVLLIQDVHGNPEAQANIARIIESAKPSSVAIEGAQGTLDFSSLRKLPDPQIIEQAARALLSKGEIGGPVYAGLTGKNIPEQFYGLENPELYRANVQAYRDSLPLKEKVSAQIQSIEKDLAKAKEEFYTPELKKLDEARAKYQEGKLSLGEYLTGLNPHLTILPDITRFLEAYRLEKSLNFQQVEQERSKILEVLVSKLKKDQLSELLGESLSYRMGKIGYAAYYGYLRSLCEKNGVGLGTCPAMSSYIHYVLLVDQIDLDKLQEEVNKAEDAKFLALAITPKQQELVRRSKQLSLIRQLVKFEMTPTGWKEYQTLTPSPSIPLPEGRGKQWMVSLRPSLAPFESFYLNAEARNRAMMGNLPAGKGISIIVAGGYHTPGITQLLKQQGINYIVLAPKITKVEGDPTAYLTVFAREKTPLEKLFEGERLFMAPETCVPGIVKTMDPAQGPRLKGMSFVFLGGVLRGYRAVCNIAGMIKTASILRKIGVKVTSLSLVMREALKVTLGEKTFDLNSTTDLNKIVGTPEARQGRINLGRILSRTIQWLKNDSPDWVYAILVAGWLEKWDIYRRDFNQTHPIEEMAGKLGRPVEVVKKHLFHNQMAIHLLNGISFLALTFWLINLGHWQPLTALLVSLTITQFILNPFLNHTLVVNGFRLLTGGASSSKRNSRITKILETLAAARQAQSEGDPDTIFPNIASLIKLLNIVRVTSPDGCIHEFRIVKTEPGQDYPGKGSFYSRTKIPLHTDVIKHVFYLPPGFTDTAEFLKYLLTSEDTYLDDDILAQIAIRIPGQTSSLQLQDTHADALQKRLQEPEPGMTDQEQEAASIVSGLFEKDRDLEETVRSSLAHAFEGRSRQHAAFLTSRYGNEHVAQTTARFFLPELERLAAARQLTLHQYAGMLQSELSTSLEERNCLSKMIRKSLEHKQNLTVFFRDYTHWHVLEYFEKVISRKWDDRRRFSTPLSFRIVMPACSTGEEPYSVAILLYKALHEFYLRSVDATHPEGFQNWLKEWDIHIDASDINLANLAIAREAVYDENIFLGRTNLEKALQPVRPWVQFRFLDLTRPEHRETLFKQDADAVFGLNLFVHLDSTVSEELMELFLEPNKNGNPRFVVWGNGSNTIFSGTLMGNGTFEPTPDALDVANRFRLRMKDHPLTSLGLIQFLPLANTHDLPFIKLNDENRRAANRIIARVETQASTPDTGSQGGTSDTLASGPTPPSRGSASQRQELIERLEKLAAPVPRQPGISPSEYQFMVLAHFIQFYVTFLEVLRTLGLFEGQKFILPAAGLDIYPALFVPTTAMDRVKLDSLKEDALTLAESATKLNRSEFERRLNYLQGLVDNWSAYDASGQAHRTVLFKGITRYALYDKDKLLTYLGGLENALDAGDRVLVLDYVDEMACAKWFDEKGWKKIDLVHGLGLDPEQQERLEHVLQTMRDDFQLQEHRVFHLKHAGFQFLMPTALAIYEKPFATTPLTAPGSSSPLKYIVPLLVLIAAIGLGWAIGNMGWSWTGSAGTIGTALASTPLFGIPMPAGDGGYSESELLDELNQINADIYEFRYDEALAAATTILEETRQLREDPHWRQASPRSYKLLISIAHSKEIADLRNRVVISDHPFGEPVSILTPEDLAQATGVEEPGVGKAVWLEDLVKLGLSDENVDRMANQLAAFEFFSFGETESEIPHLIQKWKNILQTPESEDKHLFVFDATGAIRGCLSTYTRNDTSYLSLIVTRRPGSKLKKSGQLLMRAYREYLGPLRTRGIRYAEWEARVGSEGFYNGILEESGEWGKWGLKNISQNEAFYRVDLSTWKTPSAPVAEPTSGVPVQGSSNPRSPVPSFVVNTLGITQDLTAHEVKLAEDLGLQLMPYLAQKIYLIHQYKPNRNIMAAALNRRDEEPLGEPLSSLINKMHTAISNTPGFLETHEEELEHDVAEYFFRYYYEPLRRNERFDTAFKESPYATAHFGIGLEQGITYLAHANKIKELVLVDQNPFVVGVLNHFKALIPPNRAEVIRADVSNPSLLTRLSGRKFFRITMQSVLHELGRTEQISDEKIGNQESSILIDSRIAREARLSFFRNVAALLTTDGRCLIREAQIQGNALTLQTVRREIEEVGNLQVDDDHPVESGDRDLIFYKIAVGLKKPPVTAKTSLAPAPKPVPGPAATFFTPVPIEDEATQDNLLGEMRLFQPPHFTGLELGRGEPNLSVINLVANPAFQPRMTRHPSRGLLVRVSMGTLVLLKGKGSLFSSGYSICGMLFVRGEDQSGEPFRGLGHIEISDDNRNPYQQIKQALLDMESGGLKNLRIAIVFDRPLIESFKSDMGPLENVADRLRKEPKEAATLASISFYDRGEGSFDALASEDQWAMKRHDGKSFSITDSIPPAAPGSASSAALHASDPDEEDKGPLELSFPTPPRQAVSHEWVSPTKHYEPLLPKEEFYKASRALQGSIKRTPLIELKTLSELTGKRVFLKDESQQEGDSFKARGVYYEVLVAIEEIIQNPKKRPLLKNGLKIVTQSTGNHGIALIRSVASVINALCEKYGADKELANDIRKIEPVVFALRNMPGAKRRGMEAALKEYRNTNHSNAGLIRDDYEDYDDAFRARQSYIEKQKGCALYMDHSGRNIMLGHGSSGIEIAEQLDEAGVGNDQKVALIIPAGAGGPIGIAAALKENRNNVSAIAVQSNRWDALVRSLLSGHLEKNPKNIPPTFTFQENGRKVELTFPDGIAVDGPEGEAVTLARNYLDAAVSVDEIETFQKGAVLLWHDLATAHAMDDNKVRVGGTTALTAEALLSKGDKLPALKEADVIVLFGTEGNIEPVILNFLKSQQTHFTAIRDSYLKSKSFTAPGSALPTVPDLMMTVHTMYNLMTDMLPPKGQNLDFDLAVTKCDEIRRHTESLYSLGNLISPSRRGNFIEHLEKIEKILDRITEVARKQEDVRGIVGELQRELGILDSRWGELGDTVSHARGANDNGPPQGLNSLLYLILMIPLIHQWLSAKLGERTDAVIKTASLMGAAGEGIFTVWLGNQFGMMAALAFLIPLFAAHLGFEWKHPNDDIRGPPHWRLSLVRAAVFALYVVFPLLGASPCLAIFIHILFDAYRMEWTQPAKVLAVPMTAVTLSSFWGDAYVTLVGSSYWTGVLVKMLVGALSCVGGSMTAQLVRKEKIDWGRALRWFIVGFFLPGVMSYAIFYPFVASRIPSLFGRIAIDVGPYSIFLLILRFPIQKYFISRGGGETSLKETIKNFIFIYIPQTLYWSVLLYLGYIRWPSKIILIIANAYLISMAFQIYILDRWSRWKNHNHFSLKSSLQTNEERSGSATWPSTYALARWIKSYHQKQLARLRKIRYSQILKRIRSSVDALTPRKPGAQSQKPVKTKGSQPTESVPIAVPYDQAKQLLMNMEKTQQIIVNSSPSVSWGDRFVSISIEEALNRLDDGSIEAYRVDDELRWVSDSMIPKPFVPGSSEDTAWDQEQHLYAELSDLMNNPMNLNVMRQYAERLIAISARLTDLTPALTYRYEIWGRFNLNNEQHLRTLLISMLTDFGFSNCASILLDKYLEQASPKTADRVFKEYGRALAGWKLTLEGFVQYRPDKGSIDEGPVASADDVNLTPLGNVTEPSDVDEQIHQEQLTDRLSGMLAGAVSSPLNSYGVHFLRRGGPYWRKKMKFVVNLLNNKTASAYRSIDWSNRVVTGGLETALRIYGRRDEEERKGKTPDRFAERVVAPLWEPFASSLVGGAVFLACCLPALFGFGFNDPFALNMAWYAGNLFFAGMHWKLVYQSKGAQGPPKMSWIKTLTFNLFVRIPYFFFVGTLFHSPLLYALGGQLPLIGNLSLINSLGHFFLNHQGFAVVWMGLGHLLYNLTGLPKATWAKLANPDNDTSADTGYTQLSFDQIIEIYTLKDASDMADLVITPDFLKIEDPRMKKYISYAIYELVKNAVRAAMKQNVLSGRSSEPKLFPLNVAVSLRIYRNDAGERRLSVKVRNTGTLKPENIKTVIPQLLTVLEAIQEAAAQGTATFKGKKCQLNPNRKFLLGEPDSRNDMQKREWKRLNATIEFLLELLQDDKPLTYKGAIEVIMLPYFTTNPDAMANALLVIDNGSQINPGGPVTLGVGLGWVKDRLEKIGYTLTPPAKEKRPGAKDLNTRAEIEGPAPADAFKLVAKTSPVSPGTPAGSVSEDGKPGAGVTLTQLGPRTDADLRRSIFEASMDSMKSLRKLGYKKETLEKLGARLTRQRTDYARPMFKTSPEVDLQQQKLGKLFGELIKERSASSKCATLTFVGVGNPPAEFKSTINQFIERLNAAVPGRSLHGWMLSVNCIDVTKEVIEKLREEIRTELEPRDLRGLKINIKLVRFNMMDVDAFKNAGLGKSDFIFMRHILYLKNPKTLAAYREGLGPFDQDENNLLIATIDYLFFLSLSSLARKGSGTKKGTRLFVEASPGYGQKNPASLDRLVPPGTQVEPGLEGAGILTWENPPPGTVTEFADGIRKTLRGAPGSPARASTGKTSSLSSWGWLVVVAVPLLELPGLPGFSHFALLHWDMAAWAAPLVGGSLFWFLHLLINITIILISAAIRAPPEEEKLTVLYELGSLFNWKNFRDNLVKFSASVGISTVSLIPYFSLPNVVTLVTAYVIAYVLHAAWNLFCEKQWLGLRKEWKLSLAGSALVDRATQILALLAGGSPHRVEFGTSVPPAPAYTLISGGGELGANSHLVEIGGKRVLIDAGLRTHGKGEMSTAYASALRGVVAKGLDAVLVTHAHFDHVAALPFLYRLRRDPIDREISALAENLESMNEDSPDFQEVNEKLKNVMERLANRQGVDIPIYATQETIDILNKTLANQYHTIKKRFQKKGEELPYTMDDVQDVLRCLVPIKSFTEYQLGKYTRMTAYETEHQSGAVSYELTSPTGRVLITGDFPFEMPQWAPREEPDLLVSEGTSGAGPLPERMRRNIDDRTSPLYPRHPTGEELIGYLRRVKPDRVWWTHGKVKNLRALDSHPDVQPFNPHTPVNGQSTVAASPLERSLSEWDRFNSTTAMPPPGLTPPQPKALLPVRQPEKEAAPIAPKPKKKPAAVAPAKVAPTMATPTAPKTSAGLTPGSTAWYEFKFNEIRDLLLGYVHEDTANDEYVANKAAQESITIVRHLDGMFVETDTNRWVAREVMLAATLWAKNGTDPRPHLRQLVDAAAHPGFTAKELSAENDLIKSEARTALVHRITKTATPETTPKTPDQPASSGPDLLVSLLPWLFLAALPAYLGAGWATGPSQNWAGAATAIWAGFCVVGMTFLRHKLAGPHNATDQESRFKCIFDYLRAYTGYRLEPDPKGISVFDLKSQSTLGSIRMSKTEDRNRFTIGNPISNSFALVGEHHLALASVGAQTDLYSPRHVTCAAFDAMMLDDKGNQLLFANAHAVSPDNAPHGKPNDLQAFGELKRAILLLRSLRFKNVKLDQVNVRLGVNRDMPGLPSSMAALQQALVTEATRTILDTNGKEVAPLKIKFLKPVVWESNQHVSTYSSREGVAYEFRHNASGDEQDETIRIAFMPWEETSQPATTPAPENKASSIVWLSDDIPVFTKQRMMALLILDPDIRRMLSGTITAEYPLQIYVDPTKHNSGVIRVKDLFSDAVKENPGPNDIPPITIKRPNPDGVILFASADDVDSDKNARTTLLHESGHIAHDAAYPSSAEASWRLLVKIHQLKGHHDLVRSLYNAISDYEVVRFQVEHGYPEAAADYAWHCMTLGELTVKASPGPAMLMYEYVKLYITVVMPYEHRGARETADRLRQDLRGIFLERLNESDLDTIERVIHQFDSPLLDGSWTKPETFQQFTALLRQTLLDLNSPAQPSSSTGPTLRSILTWLIPILFVSMGAGWGDFAAPSWLTTAVILVAVGLVAFIAWRLWRNQTQKRRWRGALPVIWLMHTPEEIKQRIEELLNHDDEIKGMLMGIITPEHPLQMLYDPKAPATGTIKVEYIHSILANDPEIKNLHPSGEAIFLATHDVDSDEKAREILPHEVGHIAFAAKEPGLAHKVHALLAIIDGRENSNSSKALRYMCNIFMDYEVARFQIQRGYLRAAAHYAQRVMRSAEGKTKLNLSRQELAAQYVLVYVLAVLAYGHAGTSETMERQRQKLHTIFREGLGESQFDEVEKAVHQSIAPVLLDRSWTDPQVIEQMMNVIINIGNRVPLTPPGAPGGPTLRSILPWLILAAVPAFLAANGAQSLAWLVPLWVGLCVVGMAISRSGQGKNPDSNLAEPSIPDSPEFTEARQGEFVVGKSGVLTSKRASSCVICTVRDPKTGIGLIAHFDAENANAEESYWRMRDALAKEGVPKANLAGVKVNLFGSHWAKTGVMVLLIAQGFKEVWNLSIPEENKDFSQGDVRSIAFELETGKWFNLLPVSWWREVVYKEYEAVKHKKLIDTRIRTGRPLVQVIETRATPDATPHNSRLLALMPLGLVPAALPWWLGTTIAIGVVAFMVWQLWKRHKQTLPPHPVLSRNRGEGKNENQSLQEIEQILADMPLPERLRNVGFGQQGLVESRLVVARGVIAGAIEETQVQGAPLILNIEQAGELTDDLLANISQTAALMQKSEQNADRIILTVQEGEDYIKAQHTLEAFIKKGRVFVRTFGANDLVTRHGEQAFNLAAPLAEAVREWRLLPAALSQRHIKHLVYGMNNVTFQAVNGSSLTSDEFNSIRNNSWVVFFREINDQIKAIPMQPDNFGDITPARLRAALTSA